MSEEIQIEGSAPRILEPSLLRVLKAAHEQAKLAQYHLNQTYASIAQIVGMNDGDSVNLDTGEITRGALND